MAANNAMLVKFLASEYVRVLLKGAVREKSMFCKKQFFLAELSVIYTAFVRLFLVYLASCIEKNKP